jgi:hypothetical protein
LIAQLGTLETELIELALQLLGTSVELREFSADPFALSDGGAAQAPRRGEWLRCRHGPDAC